VSLPRSWDRRPAPRPAFTALLFATLLGLLAGRFAPSLEVALIWWATLALVLAVFRAALR
jgi:hypothetical protein